MDIDNIHILRQHLLCAAKEIPLNHRVLSVDKIIDGYAFWGKKYLEAVEYLRDSGKIVPLGSNSIKGDALNIQWRWSSSDSNSSNPARSVNLRHIDPVTISIYDDSINDTSERQIDSLGYSRAFFELYEGAIFMHRGAQYLVHKLDLASSAAHTRPVNVNYYTSARNKTSINIIRPIENSGIVSM